MPSLNQVTLLGNCTRDPELKYTPKGTAVASIGIALNEQYKTESGEKRETVTFVECTAWSRTAEIAGEYLKKGSLVLIQGSLVQDSWEDKTTGQKRSKLLVRVSRLHLMGKPSGAPSDAPEAAGDEGDDSIPF